MTFTIKLVLHLKGCNMATMQQNRLEIWMLRMLEYRGENFERARYECNKTKKLSSKIDEEIIGDNHR